MSSQLTFVRPKKFAVNTKITIIPIGPIKESTEKFQKAWINTLEVR